MPKREIVTLEDLLKRPICYYCEKDFDDLKVLKTHMRQVHLSCPNCRKQLDSAGGLSVHMMQVHKEKFEAVPRALEGRDDPSVEIVGMIGFPEDLLASLHDRIRQKYYQHAAEFRARTGNPLPGSGEVVKDKQHQETPEQRKARAAAHMAKRKAEKEAAAAAAGAPTPAGQASPTNPPYAAQPSAAPNQFFVPPNSNAMSPPNVFTPSPSNENFGNGQWSAPHANPTFPPAGFQHAPMPMTAAPQHSLAPPYMPVIPTPPTVSPSAGVNQGQPRPSSAGMPPQANAGPVSIPTGSVSSTVSAPSRKKSLPSVPGLPQRPAFDSPNFSKEDMAKMHSGQQPIQPAFYGAGVPSSFPHAGAPGVQFAPAKSSAAASNPTYAAPSSQNSAAHHTQGMSHSPLAASGSYAPPNQSASPANPQDMSISDQVGQLIDSVTNGTASVASVPSAEQPAQLSDSAAAATIGASRSRKRTTPTDAAESEPAKKKKKGILTMEGWDETSDVSPEEKRAGRSRQPPQAWLALVADNALPPAAVGAGSSGM